MRSFFKFAVVLERVLKIIHATRTPHFAADLPSFS